MVGDCDCQWVSCAVNMIWQMACDVCLIRLREWPGLHMLVLAAIVGLALKRRMNL